LAQQLLALGHHQATHSDWEYADEAQEAVDCIFRMIHTRARETAVYEDDDEGLGDYASYANVAVDEAEEVIYKTDKS
jgi:hypothetical protein